MRAIGGGRLPLLQGFLAVEGEKTACSVAPDYGFLTDHASTFSVEQEAEAALRAAGELHKAKKRHEAKKPRPLL